MWVRSIVGSRCRFASGSVNGWARRSRLGLALPRVLRFLRLTAALPGYRNPAATSCPKPSDARSLAEYNFSQLYGKIQELDLQISQRFRLHFARSVPQTYILTGEVQCNVFQRAG